MIKNYVKFLYDKYPYIRKLSWYAELCQYLDSRLWSDDDWGNQRIYEMVTSVKPHAIGKLGSCELHAIRKYINTKELINAIELTENIRKTLFTNAGVFPDNYEIFEKYSRLMINEVLPEMTGMIAWFNPGEAKIINHYCHEAVLMRFKSLSPYLFDSPWTKALAGKKVLVISPFTDTINQQYLKRLLLWPNNPDVLPEFELHTLKVPLSPALAAPKHKDWFETLEVLKTKMDALDFDVALIGAGAYSLPLAVHAKQLGRQGIHLGGVAQLLFGIKGGRWENNPTNINTPPYNEHWCRPSPAETPNNVKIIENGCYW
jgi:hypothetical protein